MARRRKIPHVARRPRAAPEEALQRSIVEWLNVALVAPAMFWATPNGGYRSKKTASDLKATGTLAGIPDLFFLHRGHLLGIELKRPRAVLKSGAVSRAKAKPSEAQSAVHVRLEAAGASVFVCRSLEEVENVLRGFDIPLRASVLGR